MIMIKERPLISYLVIGDYTAIELKELLKRLYMYKDNCECVIVHDLECGDEINKVLINIKKDTSGFFHIYSNKKIDYIHHVNFGKDLCMGKHIFVLGSKNRKEL